MSGPKRYLVVTIEAGGNVPPVLGAARRLVDRGHDVCVLTEPLLEPAVREMGGRFVPFTRHFTRTDPSQQLLDDYEASSPPGALDRTLRKVVFGPAAETAADVIEAIDAERPDAVVADWMLPATIAAAEVRALPVGVLIHCINMLPAPGRPPGPLEPARGPLGRLRDGVMRRMFAALVGRHASAYNAVRSELGLEPLSEIFDQYGRADRVMVQTSEAFDFVGSPEPDNVVYTGPVLDDPPWLDEASWESPWPADDRRPLVVASLSSTFQNQRPVLQAIITALGMVDVRALVTLGPAMVDESFEVPDGVRVVASAPHSLVFERADALVTHGGHGSTMRALANGLPLVVLPMGRDQDGIAARVVHRHLGLRAKRKPQAIAAALRRVLNEPMFAAAAKRMAQQIAADVAEDRLTEELEGLVLDSGPAVAAR